MSNRRKKTAYTRGALLVELLVALSIFTLIAGISAQALSLSMLGGQLAAKKEGGVQLLSEMMEGVRGAVESNWASVYTVTKTTGHYHPVLTNGTWAIASGDETVTLDGLPYVRYVIVNDVSRDPVTKNIETTYLPAHDDPSTQQVVANVSWPDAAPVYVSEYFFRWRNKTCVQSGWTAPASSGVKTCPDTTYVNSTNITAGANLELCPGGC